MRCLVLRRFYTVMIVPHEGGALRRMSISTNFVVSMAAVFLFCFVSSAFLAHFFLGGLHRVDALERVRVENERLTLENARARSEVQRLVLRLEDLSGRLEEYASLQGDWEPPVEAMGGGVASDLDPVHGLDGDWRGVSAAAIDKADFWVQRLEEQICDRTAVLRSLPTTWPVRGRVTSGFRWRRHPVHGRRHFHTGVDIAAPHGTEVLAAGDGVVTEAGRRGGYGNLVRIDHGNGRETLYGHLRRVGIQAGARVERGQPIGEVGSTGLATGPHLHFEILEGGRPVDPLSRDYLAN